MALMLTHQLSDSKVLIIISSYVSDLDCVTNLELKL